MVLAKVQIYFHCYISETLIYSLCFGQTLFFHRRAVFISTLGHNVTIAFKKRPFRFCMAFYRLMSSLFLSIVYSQTPSWERRGKNNYLC